MGKEEIKMEIKKKILKQRKWKQRKKPCDGTRTVLRGKFIMINAYIKKKKRKISNKSPNFTS